MQSLVVGDLIGLFSKIIPEKLINSNYYYNVFFRAVVLAKVNGDCTNVSGSAIDKDANVGNNETIKNTNDDKALGSQPPVKKLRPVFSTAIRRTDQLPATTGSNVQGTCGAKFVPMFGRNLVRNKYLHLTFMESKHSDSFKFKSYYSTSHTTT